MGFLDRAKKLADQAKDLAQQAKEVAQQTLDTTTSPPRAGGGSPPPPAWGGASSPSGPTSAPAGDPRMGTAYVAGMFGRPGWRERGLVDPAAVLPASDRHRAGVPRSTKSRIVEEPFGMGRRWSSGQSSAGLFYQLYPEHQAWEPPGGKVPSADVRGAAAAVLPDGRSLVFLAHGHQRVVLEVTGLDGSAQASLAEAVVGQLESS